MTLRAVLRFAISLVLVVAVYLIYWKGPTLRKRSPLAQKLADARQENLHEGRHASIAYDGDRRGNQGTNSLQQHRFLGENCVTPGGTPRGTPTASQAPSIANLRA